MRIEQLPFAQTALGRRITQIARGVVTAAQAARDAYRIQSAARNNQPVTIEAQARGLVGRVVAAGLAAREVAPRSKDLALGSWKPFTALHGVNPELQAALRSREARQARTTAGAGLEPTAFMPFPEITLPVIAEAQRRAWSTGWVDRKCDLDMRQAMMDSHWQSVLRIRNAGIFKAPFRILPRSSSPLGLLTCAAVRAAWERLNDFRSSMGELGVQAVAGFACAELQWGEAKLTIPVGKRRITVQSEVIKSLDQCYPRNFAFDLVTDKPYLCMGPGRYVDVQEEGLQKFLFVKAVGNGPTRYRGAGWANEWLSYLGGLSLERFGIVIETFGTSVVYLNRDADGYLADDEHEHALAILERIGTGQPEVIPSRYGKLDKLEVPANLAPLHGQMIGIVKAEQSKLALSSTLQIEIGNVGSYAATNTHRDQQTDTQIIDAEIYSENLRTQPFTWICEANAERWATAFSRYVPGGCTPEDVVNETPFAEWFISDETPTERLGVFKGAKELGVPPDPDQVREELRIRAPMPTDVFLEEAEPGAVVLALPAPASMGDAARNNEPDDPPSNADAVRLAAEMTQHKVERCAHDRPNRCLICGVERVRGVLPGEDGQPHGWKVEWKAIDQGTQS